MVVVLAAMDVAGKFQAGKSGALAHLEWSSHVNIRNGVEQEGQDGARRWQEIGISLVACMAVKSDMSWKPSSHALLAKSDKFA
jgi:hypothetical protein